MYRLFTTIDENQDGSLTNNELRALVIGIQFEEIDLDHDDAVTRIMNDFDTSGNALVDEEEFVNGVCRWLQRAQRARVASGDAGPHTMKFLSDFHTVSYAILNITNFILVLKTDRCFVHRKQKGNMICWMWEIRVMKRLRALRILNGYPSKQFCFCYWVLLLQLHLLIPWLMQWITFLRLQVFLLSSFPSFFCL